METLGACAAMALVLGESHCRSWFDPESMIHLEWRHIMYEYDTPDPQVSFGGLSLNLSAGFNNTNDMNQYQQAATPCHLS